ncbi:TatA/E family protein of Tat protein translocase [Antricoccus suffuscus]|uniref:Sec-independent protein translocase protein TatA n=1 Tax=Antricoccus suffuscus TaxID=1629062 RepID=A0A2T0ZZA0_9ACTN|nr:Sec-independent protein translocase subunit TatA [Antricoccus suffuscus]PRZ41681.1 TatA/E family protein of Tat protein translocase [Antricoccus suffuscus]
MIELRDVRQSVTLCGETREPKRGSDGATLEDQMGEFSPWHLLIVAAVFVLLFGAKRLPDAARSLGRSIRILQSELHADDSKPQPAEPQP